MCTARFRGYLGRDCLPGRVVHPLPIACWNTPSFPPPRQNGGQVDFPVDELILKVTRPLYEFLKILNKRPGTGIGNGMGKIENNDSLFLSLCSVYST